MIIHSSRKSMFSTSGCTSIWGCFKRRTLAEGMLFPAYGRLRVRTTDLGHTGRSFLLFIPYLTTCARNRAKIAGLMAKLSADYTDRLDRIFPGRVPNQYLKDAIGLAERTLAAKKKAEP